MNTSSLGVSHLVDGTPEYQKPPLYYWLVAGIAWVRGGTVDAVAVRLPAAIAGWLTIVAVMGFLRRHGRPKAAWIAGLVLASTHHFLAISRTGRIDVPLTCAVTWAIIAGVEGWTWRCGLALGTGLLLKGPIGLVLVVAVLAACRKRFFAASLIGVVIALPWYVAAGPEFGREFIWHHNVERAAGTATDLARHPIWFYPARLLIDTAPWSLLLPLAWYRSESRLAKTWFLVVVGLLSLAQWAAPNGMPANDPRLERK